MAHTLSRGEILSVVDRRTKRVPVPEWGEGAEVILVEISGTTRSQMSDKVQAASANDNAGLTAVKFWLVGQCLVDDLGARLFQDDDQTLLEEKNAQVLSRLGDILMKMSGVGEKAEEEIAKNSE